MRKIKLLICYHRAAPLLRDNILTPVHAGRLGGRCLQEHAYHLNQRACQDTVVYGRNGASYSASDSADERSLLLTR